MAVDTIAEDTYPTGATAIGPVAIPNGLTRVTLALTRVSWPSVAGVLVDLVVEYQINGGSWMPWVGAGWVGGVIAQTVSSLQIPLPAGSNRALRGTVTTAASVTTAITITTT